MKITYNAFHYDVISRRLIIHAHGNEYLGGLQLRSSYERAATVYSYTLQYTAKGYLTSLL